MRNCRTDGRNRGRLLKSGPSDLLSKGEGCEVGIGRSSNVVLYVGIQSCQSESGDVAVVSILEQRPLSCKY
jgi:hypothetical protein